MLDYTCNNQFPPIVLSVRAKKAQYPTPVSSLAIVLQETEL